jgi:hypothetical protein
MACGVELGYCGLQSTGIGATNLKSIITALAIVAATATGAAAEGPRIGQVKTVSGEAAVVRDGARYIAKPGDVVRTGDVVETGDKGSIGITFVDNTVFSAGPNSQLALDQFRLDPTGGEMLAEMKRGT